MSTQDTSKQVKSEFNPVFSHRLDPEYDVNCTGHLLEAADLMILRSKSILSIIASLHTETHTNEINPQHIHWAINSVIRELDDIYAVIEAYYDAGHAKSQAQKNPEL